MMNTLSPHKTPTSLLNKLKTSPGRFYTAMPRLAYHTEYFSGGRDGNILITKGLDHDEKFIIHGVFQISRDDFCFTPDGNFNPANVFHGCLADLKLGCQLIAAISVPSRNQLQGKDCTRPSVLFGTLLATDQSSSLTVSLKLLTEIKMIILVMMAVAAQQMPDIVSSHNIRPLPAYDENHILIPPLQYEAKLRGALVEVHMAFCHTKKSKCDIFDAVLQELIVLLPPAPMPSSPFKRQRLNDGPYTEQYNKGN
ncbi:hypothetical protein BDR06DRAFT_1043603 [Suillus hirtellus]|nr:hypothetical protein BDR06DRAFT_1043603 [Suillus hirtellus]